MLGKKRRKGEIREDITLIQMEKKQRYDVFAALAKALLVFLLVYGAIGGFLSAYDIQYNKGTCMLLLFFLALILGVVCETGKKWLINLFNFAFFILYAYVAFHNYWLINSGYYSIINTIYETARNYLGVAGLTEYSLVVEEEYAAVTGFVLFAGMAGTLLINIQLQNKANFLKTVLTTLPLYAVPLYFDESPELIYILFLFTGYAAVAMLQGVNVKEHLAAQVRYVLPFVAVVVIVVVRLTFFLLPQGRYEVLVPKSAGKAASEKTVAKYAQFGMMAMFGQNANGAGISNGKLSKGSAVMPDYETDLIMRFTPYSYDPVYLKAFTGKEYLGDRWTRAEDRFPDDGRMEASVAGRYAAWDASPQRQGRGVMEIENVGASRVYQYHPYYTDYESIKENEHGVSYVYYPFVSAVDVETQPIDDAYREVPGSCLGAVQKICEEAGFSGTPEEIAAQIVRFFEDNYPYTLRPGFYYGSPDFITHFLLESKKGYCQHFASAGTMLFRNMGIPARYVEGYAVSYSAIVADGVLVEDASYGDYYSGYSPIGETALVEMEIPDASAHAWVEIYVDGKGWLVVDPTPSTVAEEATSFWDAFLSNNREEQGPDFGQDNVGVYLENTLKGAVSVFLVLLAVALFVWMIRQLLEKRKEARLPGRERIRLLYGRLTKQLGRKHKDFASLRTIREQLDWMEEFYGIEIPEGFADNLYQGFFAKEEAQWEELFKMTALLNRRVKRGALSIIDKKVQGR